MKERLEKLAQMILGDAERVKSRELTASDVSDWLMPKYVAELRSIADSAPSAKPIAHLHRTQSNVIECNYRGHLCPVDGNGFFEDINIPLNKSVPVYMHPPATSAPSAEPVAWLQIGINDHEGTAIARTNLPKSYNPQWWKFIPLYTAPAADAQPIRDGYLHNDGYYTFAEHCRVAMETSLQHAGANKVPFYLAPPANSAKVLVAFGRLINAAERMVDARSLSDAQVAVRELNTEYMESKKALGEYHNALAAYESGKARGRG